MITPCVADCKLVEGVCRGCKRTKDQISSWKTYTDEERLNIMKSLGYGRRRKRGS